MAISVLVETLFPGGGGGVERGEDKPLPKDEAGAKEWVKNQRKALARLLGRLGAKASEALPCIIGAILVEFSIKLQM